MKRPNVLWFYCDELRTDALGCYGNPFVDVQTPHIDALALSGTLFRNHFCNSPVCVPSRMCTMTGLYPEDTGVYSNEANWPGFVLEGEYDTLPEVFARSGYRTVDFGKMHLPRKMRPFGERYPEGGEMTPFYEGVDRESLGIVSSGRIPTVIGGHYPGDRPYPAQPVFDNAVRWLEEAEVPFFMRVSILQPHTPVFPPPPFDTMYDGAPFPDTIRRAGTPSRFERALADVIDAEAVLSPRQIYLAQVYYHGLVAWIDAGVGRVMARLRERGLAENTIVVFDADHGASLGENGLYCKQVFAPQTHRTPFIVAWAGEMRGPVVRNDICDSIDLARTWFGMAGIDSPEQFRGRDLFRDPPPEAVFSTIGYGFPDSRPFPNLGDSGPTNRPGWPRRACVRTAQYRLDRNVRRHGKAVEPGDMDVFLAVPGDDPAEVVNRAEDAALGSVRERLMGLLNAHVDGSVEVAEEYTFR